MGQRGKKKDARRLPKQRQEHNEKGMEQLIFLQKLRQQPKRLPTNGRKEHKKRETRLISKQTQLRQVLLMMMNTRLKKLICETKKTRIAACEKLKRLHDMTKKRERKQNAN